MVSIVWLIAHLVAGVSAAQDAAAVTAGSCTYAACMAKCSRPAGPACNSYCEVKVSQRIAAGLCPAPADPGDISGD